MTWQEGQPSPYRQDACYRGQPRLATPQSPSGIALPEGFYYDAGVEGMRGGWFPESFRGLGSCALKDVVHVSDWPKELTTWFDYFTVSQGLC